jgi:hypothetical protein
MARIKLKPEGEKPEGSPCKSPASFRTLNIAACNIKASPATTLEGKAEDMRNYVHFVTTRTRELLEKAMKVLDRQLDSDNEITAGYAVKHTIPVADLNMKLMKRLDELDEQVAAKLAKEVPVEVDESIILEEGAAAMVAIREAMVA